MFEDFLKISKEFNTALLDTVPETADLCIYSNDNSVKNILEIIKLTDDTFIIQDKHECFINLYEIFLTLSDELNNEPRVEENDNKYSLIVTHNNTKIKITKEADHRISIKLIY